VYANDKNNRIEEYNIIHNRAIRYWLDEYTYKCDIEFGKIYINKFLDLYGGYFNINVLNDIINEYLSAKGPNRILNNITMCDFIRKIESMMKMKMPFLFCYLYLICYCLKSVGYEIILPDNDSNIQNNIANMKYQIHKISNFMS
jgi:hypothetical protein